MSITDSESTSTFENDDPLDLFRLWLKGRIAEFKSFESYDPQHSAKKAYQDMYDHLDVLVESHVEITATYRRVQWLAELTPEDALGAWLDLEVRCLAYRLSFGQDESIEAAYYAYSTGAGALADMVELMTTSEDGSTRTKA